MLCESCGEYEANVHLTHIVNGVTRKLNLCEQCASKSGISLDGPMSVGEMLMMGLNQGEEGAVGRPEKACPFCRMRLSDFRKSSRLGCAVCYDTFGPELNPLLAGMHKGSKHAGKQPQAFGEGESPSPRAAELQEKLDEAVKAENYEEAARLRDLICVERAAGERAEAAEPAHGESPGQKGD